MYFLCHNNTTQVVCLSPFCNFVCLSLTFFFVCLFCFVFPSARELRVRSRPKSVFLILSSKILLSFSHKRALLCLICGAKLKHVYIHIKGERWGGRRCWLDSFCGETLLQEKYHQSAWIIIIQLLLTQSFHQRGK